MPLVDAAGRFVRLVHLSDLEPEAGSRTASRFEFAVIMAGGEGVRLRPLTHDIPKPMVEIGGMPMLERQIRRLAKAGLQARLHRGELPEPHDRGSTSATAREFGVEIRYLREREKLGTGRRAVAAARAAERPVVVMNGDMLTTSDFGSLYAFHAEHGAHVSPSRRSTTASTSRIGVHPHRRPLGHRRWTRSRRSGSCATPASTPCRRPRWRWCPRTRLTT